LSMRKSWIPVKKRHTARWLFLIWWQFIRRQESEDYPRIAEL
jgi:Uncharacterized conserved protein